jgi:HK97 family phage prohead protease
VFDSPTRIDSWEGRFDESIARGAFSKSIRERTPVLQFDHGQHPKIGSLPIGKIESLDEDGHGLHVKARLFDDPETGLLRQAIAAGAIDGMSFRFSVVKDEWTDDDVPKRTLREVKVMELGPVVFPAYADTTASLRAHQFAQELTDDPKFARDVADALILRGLDITKTTDADRAADGHSGADGSITDEPPAGHSAPTPTLRERIRAERELLQDTLYTRKETRRG